jgi:16S rRNA processing protein RimM
MGLWLRFGVLRRPHGTKGEIFLAPYNRQARTLAEWPCPVAVRLTSGSADDASASEAIDVDLVAVRPVHEGYLVRLAGRDSRESLAALVGWQVHLPRQAFAPLREGEFYVDDTVGCEVFQASGTCLGRVKGVFWNGAQDVMAVVAEDGTERLLPVVPALIRSFDVSLRRVIVDYDE